jgi:hypothetical protein
MTCRICCFCLKALLTWNFIGKCHLNHYKQFVLVFFNLTCSSFEWINGSDHFSPNQKKWKVLYVLITTRITVLVDIFLQKKLRKIRQVILYIYIYIYIYIENVHTLAKLYRKEVIKLENLQRKEKKNIF